MTERWPRRFGLLRPVPDNGGIQFGTGWIVDAKRRLIVTNEHVIDISDDVKIYFPEHDDGRLQTEIEYYLKKARPVDGVVLDSDTPRDLALIQVDSLPAGTQELSIAETSARNTDQLHSVGAWPRGSGGLWVYSRGIVSNVVRRRIANGFDSLVVESDMPTNRGSSGSAVLNDAGEVVAVVEGGDERGSRVVSLFIDRSELQTFLDESIPLLDPKTAEQFVQRGERHLDERRYLIAIDDFNQALKADPKLAKAYAGRGWGFYYEEDSTTALNDFAKAIELEPTLADAHHGRGLVHRELGKHQEAIADFSNAIRNDPSNFDSYNERGITYTRLRDYNKAAADYTRAIERNEDDAMLYFNRALAHQSLSQYRTAIKDLQQAIQRNDRNSEFFNRLGVCQFELGDHAKARDSFANALKIAKKDLYYTNLAISLQRLSQHGLAIEACNLALGLNQNFARAWQYRGISRRVLQQFQEALADFNRAIQLQPKVAAHYFQRGLTLEAMKRASEANRDFAKATELDPKRFPTRQIQISKAETPKLESPTPSRDTKTPQVPRLTGTWKFRGQIDGASMRSPWCSPPKVVTPVFGGNSISPIAKPTTRTMVISRTRRQDQF